MYQEVHQVWTYLQPHKSILPQNNEAKSSAVIPERTRHVLQLTRIKKRINVIDLANRVGSTPDAISAYERGEHVLPHDIVVKMCKTLEVDMKTLV
jgi:DNA-binding Xre family transcriptional regulator